MNIELSAVDLEALSREARQCFLFEEAPDCLASLEEGVQGLSLHPAQISDAQYTALIRAAHSLKGGAGLAQLSVLGQLSHHLEDLLELLQQGIVTDPDTAHELLTLGVEQVRTLITEASHDQPEPELATLPIVALLADFLDRYQLERPMTATATPDNSELLKMALEMDLEECLQCLETHLQVNGHPDRLPKAIEALSIFIQEAKLLGETLELQGLLEQVGKLEGYLEAQPATLIADTVATLADIRLWRQQTLNPEPCHDQLCLSDAQVTPTSLDTAVDVDPAAGLALIAELETTAQQATASVAAALEALQIAAPQTELGPVATHLPLKGFELPTTVQSAVTEASHLNLRMPFAKVDRMGNTVGELLINHERLGVCQSQLRQIGLELKRRAEELHPLQEQVQTFYDRLATDWVNDVPLPHNNDAHAEFDALQFDRYSDFHSTLQALQELMLRIQETRSDIDLVHQELQETLDQSRQYLNGLGQDLHQSRLVPFKHLAQRFVPALQGLNQQYHKSVELEIVGETTLIDQLLVEQLRNPLTHLFRNAFDHGIETSDERQALGKPETATIKLSAKVQGNQVVIAIADDGRGIDIAKVGQQAIAAGLCTREQLQTLSRSQILEFLFASGFSTAQTVTSLSGRGVGLDVVRLQVQRLRGSIRVQTALGEGTQFLLSVPLTISILPLLLCQCETLTLALPSASVREIVNLDEYRDHPQFPHHINWQDQGIEIIPLRCLLPYHQAGLTTPKTASPPLAVVVDVDGQAVGVSVDTLLAERELVLKPFDTTVPVPPYVTGCTVLGTGEVVPILAPNHFQILISAYHQTARDNSADLDAWNESVEQTILIVDDSIAVRHLLNQVLTQSGYKVVDCRDGKEALQQLNHTQHHFDLVISDIEMPRLDGYTLLKEIRTHPRWFGVPVAMLTSRASAQHRQKAMSLGATAYMDKPFQPQEMLETVQALLSLEFGESIEF